MAPLLLLNLLGCASPFEGTWLFLADRESKSSGDCADDTDTTTYTGTDNQWVDIYRLQSGEFTVLLLEALVGTVEGSDLSASWEQALSSDGYEERDTLDLEAALDGTSMSGKLTYETTQTSGEDIYTCKTVTGFSAERTVSSPTSYPEN